MSKESLRKHLDQLHAELASAERLDPETRASLQALADDIERLLAADSSESRSLLDRLEAASMKFEAEHPNLARIMSEVTDALAKIGV
ncbi:MAG TPA: DUF4404 family protein [Gammaproteobacteria bacterium]